MSAKRISGLFVLVASVLVCACTAPAATEVPFEVEEWTAEWIGAPWDGEEFDPELVQPAPEFMTSFNASKRIRSAVASVTGLGFFEFYVNGIKCGEDVLSPNETSYAHRETLWDHAISMDDSNWRGFRVFYLSYDITKLLRRGDNVISALVGNGFYAIKAGWVDPYGTPRFLCQVDVTYEDGTTERVSTDENWKVRRSPIVMNDMYKGEIYDARLEDADEWQPAVHRKAPDGRLMLQDGVPDRVVRTIEPSSVRQLEDGSWELLFDEYVTGWIRLCNFQAPEGTEIEIDFPIEVDGNGVYKYISNGQKVASYAPRFCWWAYDRAVIKGWPGKLRPSNFVAEVVNSDVRENAHFECSNTLFNRICEIWKQSMLDNMHLGVETDCPHREKGPYTGDGELTALQILALLKESGKKAFADVFRVFLDEANYPIDIHCIGGADRTGCACFIINALLGVAQDDLDKDWEIPCYEYEDQNFGHKYRYDKFLKVLADYPGDTPRARCEAYVKELGFTDADLARLRQILLED